MLPNIFGNIGGAEKTGWATHYHSFYFPALAWAAALGYGVLVERTATRKQLKAIPYAVVAVLLFLFALMNPTVAIPPGLSFANVSTSFFPTLADHANKYVFQSGARDAFSDAADGIEQSIPRGSVVSTIEAGMPILYPDRTLEFFPKDIDNADYAVLGAEVVDGAFVYNGTISFLPDQRQKIDKIVIARMKRDHYDLDHPKLFPAIAGIAVVRRIH